MLKLATLGTSPFQHRQSVLLFPLYTHTAWPIGHRRKGFAKRMDEWLKECMRGIWSWCRTAWKRPLSSPSIDKLHSHCKSRLKTSSSWNFPDNSRASRTAILLILLCKFRLSWFSTWLYSAQYSFLIAPCELGDYRFWRADFCQKKIFFFSFIKQDWRQEEKGMTEDGMNWHTSLYKFKAYSMMAWFTYIDHHRRFR